MFLRKISTFSQKQFLNTFGGKFKKLEIIRKIATNFKKNQNIQSVGHNLSEGVLPFAAIPRVKGYPIIGSVLESRKWRDKAHILHQKRFQELGPIYVEKLGPVQLVYLSDVAAIEKLHRWVSQTKFN